jgi:dihydrofolate synthase/folylpolyglutamate synthase
VTGAGAADWDWRGWLDGHVNLETGVGLAATEDRRRDAPTLDRIRRLVELLGSPQRELPAVHLTGTNGKTSVARMTSALLVGSGLSVGTYTSPHLEAVNERIAWNGDAISDAELAGVLAHVATVEEFLPDRASYFELVTAAAFDWFADVAVEMAVVEVGLGGTWDATNVLDAATTVVTNVSLDHTNYLGPTRADIAADKAGIVHPGSHLVLGERDPALHHFFAAREPERIVLRDRDFGVRGNRLAVGGRVVDLYTPAARYDDVFLSVHGAHQADNAAVALTAAETALGGALEEAVVAETFATMTSPGRLEVVGHQPLVLLDGAHNVAGAEALVRALAEEFVSAHRTLVVGLLREKDPAEMLAALDASQAAHLICTRPPSPRALAETDLADAAIAVGVDPAVIDVVADPAAALRRARDVTPPDGQIIVTGTLYLVGAARHALVPPG